MLIKAESFFRALSQVEAAKRARKTKWRETMERWSQPAMKCHNIENGYQLHPSKQKQITVYKVV